MSYGKPLVGSLVSGLISNEERELQPYDRRYASVLSKPYVILSNHFLTQWHISFPFLSDQDIALYIDVKYF